MENECFLLAKARMFVHIYDIIDAAFCCSVNNCVVEKTLRNAMQIKH